MSLSFPTLTEDQARALIKSGQAGYWELSLRDSISKTPIAHPERIVVYLGGEWYSVPASAMGIKDHGRAGDEHVNCKLDLIELLDPELIAAAKAELAAKGHKLYFCHKCGYEAPHYHTHETAFGLPGTHMLGTESFKCAGCGHAVYASSPEAEQFPFQLDTPCPVQSSKVKEQPENP